MCHFVHISHLYCLTFERVTLFRCADTLTYAYIEINNSDAVNSFL